MKQLHRIMLADLPEWESKGWRPCTVAECGAVGATHYSAGQGAEVLIEHTMSLPPLTTSSRAYRAACAEANERIVGQLEAWLARPGLHGHMLRARVLQALIEAAEMAGDREAACELALAKTELARAHDAEHGGR